MKRILYVLAVFFILPAFGDGIGCIPKIPGYSVVANSTFPFLIDNEKACFFAFYTPNPEPGLDAGGNGNLGSSIWYGYYFKKSLKKRYEFPKPSDNDWSNVCTVSAVSFYDMNGDNKPDVTVIGSCNRNTINYTVPFVFTRVGGDYVLNERLYKNLYGMIGLTVSDVRNYIKSPDKYFKILEAKK